MNNEIKQGDMVRVSKDAQEIFVYGLNPLWFTEESTVISTHPDGVVIKLDANNYLATGLPIPAKYLIKVDAEAKEPKFKKGDKVKYVGKEHPEYWGEIFTVDGEIFYNDYHKNMQIDSIRCEKYNICNVPLSDLVLYTEPTAPSIKVGDRVRCKNPIRLANSTDDDFIGTVTDVENGWFIVHMNNGAIFQTYHKSDLELVQPKEQAEAEEITRIRQMEAELNEFRKAELDRVLHPEKYHTYEVTVDNVAMDWQRYEADLAKEIALKVANKNMDNTPEDIGEYAVQVAKAVVENLKKKII